MSTYNAQTMSIIETLVHQNLNIAEQYGVTVLRIPDTDFEQFLPKRTDRARDFILRVKLPKEKKNALAARMGVDPSVLTFIVNEKRARTLTRDQILASVLLMDPVPSVDEVNHILMEFGRPGVFLKTYDLFANQRNWILNEILACAGEEPCPVSNWLEYANLVLTDFEMEPLNSSVPTRDLPSAEQPRLERWRMNLDIIGFQDFGKARKEHLERFRQVHGLTMRGGKTAALEKLSSVTGIQLESVLSAFGSVTNRNSHVSREVLIQLAIAMGCTIRQTNLMLMESNQALLYPHQNDRREVLWVQALKRNESQKIDKLHT